MLQFLTEVVEVSATKSPEVSSVVLPQKFSNEAHEKSEILVMNELPIQSSYLNFIS